MCILSQGLGTKYMVFVSSRPVKMRGSSAFSVCIFLRKENERRRKPDIPTKDKLKRLSKVSNRAHLIEVCTESSIQPLIQLFGIYKGLVDSDLTTTKTNDELRGLFKCHIGRRLVWIRWTFWKFEQHSRIVVIPDLCGFCGLVIPVQFCQEKIWAHVNIFTGCVFHLCYFGS